MNQSRVGLRKPRPNFVVLNAQRGRYILGIPGVSIIIKTTKQKEIVLPLETRSLTDRPLREHTYVQKDSAYLMSDALHMVSVL